MPKPPEVGAPAPSFALPGLQYAAGGTERRQYRLADAAGSPLVLVFYPGDGTPVCTRQLCSYTTDLGIFHTLGAEVWAISGQDLDSHEAFARRHQLAMPLLYDREEQVAAEYGITAPGIGVRRSVFVLDGEGVVRWRHTALVGLTYRSTETIARELQAISGR